MRKWIDQIPCHILGKLARLYQPIQILRLVVLTNLDTHCADTEKPLIWVYTVCLCLMSTANS